MVRSSFFCYSICIRHTIMGTAKTVNNGTQPYKLYFIVANIKFSSGCVFLYNNLCS
ncbi:hypothetical protein BE20_0027 [Staphylococcus phage vB_SepS_BE20]|nr:hypothetical protein BE20_0027 [Staphylococcus phage vB_SepS_BE20]